MADDPSIDAIVEALSEAGSLLVITGAGISADSGLPTYRGLGGLYDGQTTADAVPIETALSGPMLAANPALCWKYIAQIEAACRGAEPNAAHFVLAELERRLPRMWVLTQNVDGFHRAAGSQNVIEIHGDLHRLRCTGCDHRSRVPDYAELSLPPACPRCNALVRPEVVLFEELLPREELDTLRTELARGFDAVISVGTSHAFPYILEPLIMARRAGAFTADINPEATIAASIVDVSVAAGAKAAFEAIAAQMSLPVR